MEVLPCPTSAAGDTVVFHGGSPIGPYFCHQMRLYTLTSMWGKGGNKKLQSGSETLVHIIPGTNKNTNTNTNTNNYFFHFQYDTIRCI